MKRRFLSMLLAFAMVLTIAPVSASAEALDPGTSPDQSGLGAGAEVITAPELVPEYAEFITAYEFDFAVFAEPKTITDFSTFGAQLAAGGTAKKIYDALCDASNKDALYKGEPIYVVLESQDFGLNDAGISTFVNRAGTCYDAKDVRSAVAAFDRDRSDVFWTSGVTYVGFAKQGNTVIDGNYSATAGTYSIGVSVTLPKSFTWKDATVEQIKADEQLISTKVQEIATAAQASSTDKYAQLCYVNDWLTKNNSYNHPAAEDGSHSSTKDSTPWEAISALGVKDGLSPVCEGYSRAFKLICDELGINCILVSGLGNGGAHMWNYAKLSNSDPWYAIDITWNDGSFNGQDTDGDREWLMLGSDEFNNTNENGTHVTQGNTFLDGGHYEFQYPGLNSTRYKDNNAPQSISITASNAELTFEGGYPGYTVPEKENSPKSVTLTATGAEGKTCHWTMTPQKGVTLVPGTDNNTATLNITCEALKDLATGAFNGVIVKAYCSTTSAEQSIYFKREPSVATTLEVTGPDAQPVSGPYEITQSEGRRFTAKVLDQYGTAMADQSAITWEVDNNYQGATVTNGVVSLTEQAVNGNEFSVTVIAGGLNQTISFKVKADPKQLKEDMLMYTAPTDLTYDGQPKTPTIALKDGEPLVQETDYTVTYKRDGKEDNNTTDAGTITVEIKGIGNYTGTLTRTYTIEKFQPAITVNPTITDLYVGGKTKLDVDAKGHNNTPIPVRDLKYTSSEDTIATVAYDTTVGAPMVTAIKAGDATITVSYPESTNYKAASATVTVKVNARTPVATVTIDGEPVFGNTLTATVTDLKTGENEANLTYAWYRDNGTEAIGTEKTYTVTANDIRHKLTVKVTGETNNFDPATSAAVDAVAITTAVTLNLTKNPIEVGETTAANVTVTPTNGTNKGTALTNPAVNFASSDTSVATVDTAGNVTALKAGTTDITATFPEQDGYEAATSEAVTLEVTKKSLEACTFAITLNQDSFPYTGSKQEATVNSVVATPSGGDPVTLAATDYKVSYEGDSTNVGTITVKITPAENGSYTWTTPKTKTYTITQATFASSEEIIVPVKNVAGSTATKDLTKLYPVTQSDAGTVAYTVTGGMDVDGTVESGILKLTVKNSPAAGSTETITVATTALKNYSTATFTIKVQYTDKTPVTITATPAANLVYDGTAKTATASGAPDGVTLEYSYSGVEGTTYGPLAEAPINAGKYSVTAKIPDTNTDYAGADTVNFEIVPKPVTVKAKTVSVNVGDPMPALYEVEGLVGSDTFVPTVTGAPENTNTAGEFPFTVSGADTSADGNYSITYEPASGKVTVAKQTAATPTATPENRTFTGSVDVTLNCTTPGAKIYYVTDTAKDPAIEGTEFTRAITLTETTTIKAIAKVDGMNNSDPLEVTYTKQPTVVDPDPQPPVQQVATPVIEPAGGQFYTSVQVRITCATPGATVYYSINNGAFNVFTDAFVLTDSVVVRAYAMAPGMTDSNPATAAFTRYTYTPDPTPDPDPDPEPDNNYEPPVSSNNNNSNNSSNSSNSSTTQPTTPTQPETPTVPEVTARPEATVDGGTASAAVPAETVEKLVEQAVSGKSGTLVIAPVIGGDVTKAEVTLPANAVTAIANATSASLRVETPVAEVTIPNDSLAGLGNQGAEIAVTAEKSEDGGVDVAVVVDGQRVENVPIKAAIPTPCGPGTVAKIVDANGNVISTVRKSSASGDGQTMNVPLDGSAKVVFVDSGKSFPDVPATNWAADAVAFASSHELMNGVNEETFSPSTPMTRGMLAVVLHNLEGNPGTSYQGGFSDVTGSAWYAEAVQWASEKKVVTGLSDGVFAPDAPITREQLVVMLYRYMGEPAVSGSSLGRFSDSGTVSDWAAQAMSWAVANGVVNGSNGALNPQGSATRAEVAQMLMNFVSSGML